MIKAKKLFNFTLRLLFVSKSCELFPTRFHSQHVKYSSLVNGPMLLSMKLKLPL